MQIKLQIAESFAALFKPKRYKVYFGGRGGAKSWAFAQALLAKGVEQPLRILCTREIQDSLQESVMKLLSQQIDKMELNGFYTVQKQTIIGANGTSFIFEGLRHNTTKIKSMEGIDIVWVEEAEAITGNSWDLLIPTIRKDGSEIWVGFNPADEMDDTYQRFVVPHLNTIETDRYYEDATLYVRRVTWEDNPWFPEALQQEMALCKKVNYRKYLHIWCGECNADYSDAIIQPEWFDAAIDAHIKLKLPLNGVCQAGFDPADRGDDAKALIVRHGVVVKKMDEWLDGDLGDAVNKALEISRLNHCKILAYDSIGVGSGVYLRLKQVNPHGMEFVSFNGAERVTEPDEKYGDDMVNADVFKNRRAQWWWLLRDRLEKTYRAVEHGEYINPDELISFESNIKALPKLKSELCRVRRKRGTANAYIQLESKDDMRKRGVKSPNLADALVYAFFDAGLKRSKHVVQRMVTVDSGGWT